MFELRHIPCRLETNGHFRCVFFPRGAEVASGAPAHHCSSCCLARTDSLVSICCSSRFDSSHTCWSRSGPAGTARHAVLPLGGTGGHRGGGEWQRSVPAQWGTGGGVWNEGGPVGFGKPRAMGAPREPPKSDRRRWWTPTTDPQTTGPGD